MESRTKNGSDIQVIKVDKIGKGSKQDKVDSSEHKLRVRLDMCSKRGDVIAAIQLYDLAQREGIKMGQYHYAVLLYLCSSAAVGGVQPAKSGSESGGRAIDSLDVSNEVSNVKFQELSELRDEDDRKVDATELHIRVSNNRKKLVDADREPGSIAEMELNHGSTFGNLDDKESLVQFFNECNKLNFQHLDGRPSHGKDKDVNIHGTHEIQFSEDVKKYALQRGCEIFEKMCKEKVPINEATLTAVARMAMSIGNGDLAFEMVKQMDALGINPKLRSYGPALSVFCSSGDIDKAFYVEKHMLEHGVYPEEPELKALLRVSVEGGKGDKVYYLLHKLRRIVRRVSPSTAGIIVRWFNSKAASRVGKTKWDVKEAIENGGGGWHGQGWLGKGKWTVSCTSVGLDGICKYCGQKLTTIDLDAVETEKFAESVASIAIKRDRDSSFQRFQVC
jgi:proteinaceous RNase P